MRNLLTAIAAASVIATGASGNELARQLCTTEGKTAGLIMHMRQAGVSAPKIVDALGSDYQAKVDRAFQEPRYRAEGSRRRAVVAFENAIYSECYLAY